MHVYKLCIKQMIKLGYWGLLKSLVVVNSICYDMAINTLEMSFCIYFCYDMGINTLEMSFVFI